MKATTVPPRLVGCERLSEYAAARQLPSVATTVGQTESLRTLEPRFLYRRNLPSAASQDARRVRDRRCCNQAVRTPTSCLITSERNLRIISSPMTNAVASLSWTKLMRRSLQLLLQSSRPATGLSAPAPAQRAGAQRLCALAQRDVVRLSAFVPLLRVKRTFIRRAENDAFRPGPDHWFLRIDGASANLRMIFDCI